MRLVLASVAVLSLVGACAGAPMASDVGSGPPAAAAERPLPHIQVRERIAPRVHVLRQPEVTFAGVMGNVTIIEQSDGLVLVDSGNSHGAGVRVVEQVRAISNLPVKAVIITHWHNDHPLGLSAIVAAWPNVEIISTQRTLEDMQAGRLGVPPEASPEYSERRVQLLRDQTTRFEPRATDQTLSAREREEWARLVQITPARFPDQAGTHLVLPRTTFTERHVIPDSQTPVEALFLGRANTDGDAAIWLPRQRILIAGDAVVSPIPYMFNMYPADQIATLERMKAMRPRVIVPGHGEVMRDTTYLDQLIGLIRDTQTQFAPLVREGLTLEDATARADFSVQRARFTGGDEWLNYWFDQYALTPLLDSVYREAKGEPLGPPPVAAP